MGAWDLWNLAVIPSLLNNCSTWVGITSKMVDKLEATQERYIRLLLEVPVSTPKASLRAETGLLSMKHRIWFEKVNLILAIRKMKQGLAKEMYEEQVYNGWPGLAKEVSEICDTIGMIDANENIVTKKELTAALRQHDRKEIVENFNGYKKLDIILNDDPTTAKDYMEKKTIEDARMIFRIRTEMIDVKDNMRNRYKKTGVNCDACDLRVAESQLHVMSCPGYAELRVGKDMTKDTDMVSYFREVMIQREKSNR